ncbi:MAG: methionyl-tRNA formyltransferase, partial [Candidatus Humimicrobiaceae bacterium]
QKNYLKRRLVFFGTKGWDLTNRILEFFIRHEANIVGFVIDTSASFASTVKKSHAYDDICDIAAGKNIFCLYPQDIRDKKFLKDLEQFHADIFIVCGFQYFLPSVLINMPELGTLNFHTSLLPRHAGMHPGFWTIWYGDKKSGMTIHFMDEGIDTGNIAYQSGVPVIAGDTIESLYHRIWDSSESLVEKLLQDIESKSIPRIKQDYSDYFYNYEITDKDFELDFRQPAETLFGRIKMMPDWFYIRLKDEKIYITDCRIINEFTLKRKFCSGSPVLFDDKIIFVTPRGYIEILEIKNISEKTDLIKTFDLLK